MRRVAAAILALGLAACGLVGGVKEKPEKCARLRSERQLRGDHLCEDVFMCMRPPGGRFNRIGLRRLAFCEGATGPVVLYLPGMHQNAELPQTDARYDIRMHLALAGVRAWGLDYRTHAVPADVKPEELSELAGWTADVFASDAEWAVGFVRTADPGPLYVAGFSYGAGVAYRLASRRVPMQGLVILDGTPPAGGYAPEGSGAALDVGSSRLPWPERERLLSAVLKNPRSASPVPGFASAGATLEDIVYTSSSFGGNGGLSAARDGVTDVVPLARLLASYDRWWPRAALGGGTVSPRAIPVIAFASQNMGPEWAQQVRAGAKAFGGEKAVVRLLPRFGHLDVLVGNNAARMVFEPALDFVTSPGGAR